MDLEPKKIEMLNDFFKPKKFNLNRLNRLIEIQKSRLNQCFKGSNKVAISLELTKRENYFFKRRSIRTFLNKSLSFEDFSNLLINSLGVRPDSNTLQPYSLDRRPYPSAGGLNLVNFVVFINNVEGLKKGYYFFNPYKQKLIKLNIKVNIKSILKHSKNVDLMNFCFALFILSYSKPGIIKYGLRGYKYALIEVGHASQNILLYSTYFDMNGVCLGAFDEELADKRFKILKGQKLEYVVVIGKNV